MFTFFLYQNSVSAKKSKVHHIQKTKKNKTATVNIKQGDIQPTGVENVFPVYSNFKSHYFDCLNRS